VKSPAGRLRKTKYPSAVVMTLRLGGDSGPRAIGLGVEGLPDASKWPMSVTMAPPTGASVPISTTRPRSTFVPLGMGGVGVWAWRSVALSAAIRRTRSAVRVMACASTFQGQGQLAWFIMPYVAKVGGVSNLLQTLAVLAAAVGRPRQASDRRRLAGGTADLSISERDLPGGKLPRPANRSRERSERWRGLELR